MFSFGIHQDRLQGAGLLLILAGVNCLQMFLYDNKTKVYVYIYIYIKINKEKGVCDEWLKERQRSAK